MMTKYVIKLTGGYYLANHPSNHHWTEDINKAMQFNSMVGADGYAIMEMGIPIEMYTVELLMIG